MCMIAGGNLWLELFEFANPAGKAKDPNYPVSDRGISHFGMTVDDIHATYDKLKAAGVPIHGRLQTFAGGGMRAAYCRDPDGNVFEIMQPGERYAGAGSCLKFANYLRLGSLGLFASRSMLNIKGEAMVR